ncbi:carboxylesterase/lipase family protein [Streptomyces lutosisoli]|uniref:Carboxylic ester hydrolase n=1 Tax=Streptomyces lutosisoli TaxID=2665721 RepID=A0ABW2W4A3_9ACTN
MAIEVVDTTLGPVEGTLGERVHVFKGIPFAAPPVGPLRFKPPQPPAPWTEAKPVQEYGPAAPQPRDLVLEQMFGHAPFPTSEVSCLTLNVWTPHRGAENRPVMVWLHGGAFLTGSGRDPVFDGSRLASLHDVVVVTVNYRLGALGFLYLGELLGDEYASSGNVGLLDQIAALRWVRDNIAAFGGDPGNVTLFGQSAGAMSVLSLMAMPAAQGLFHKAIAQSGSAECTHTRERATAVARDVLAALALPEHEAHRLLELPVATLLYAQQSVVEVMRQRGDALGLPFAPVVDGPTLPRAPLEAFTSGAASPVPLIAGTTLEEGRLFLVGPESPNVDDAAVTALFDTEFDKPEEALEAFRGVQPDTSPMGLLAALMGERMFRAPTARLLEAHAARTSQVWTYLFSWRSSARGGQLGACHSLDLPFVFDNLHAGGADRFTGKDAPQRLADALSSAWASFAHHGHPGVPWPAFDTAHRATMVFDVTSRMVRDPWNGVRLLTDSSWRPPSCESDGCRGFLTCSSG